MHKLQFDDFEQLESIGVGTVGTIFRVREKSTGQMYALKLLSPGISHDKLIAARFEREIMVLSKLKHPGIVSYVGHGEHNGQLFYVMELLEAGTLKSLIENTGPLSWHEAADCGRQIASALQHAHNHGIIHRDLKPGNVFLSTEAQAKLGDFGIARDQKESGLTETGLTVGTYAYMPPELVKGESEITGKVDLYALGCLLFEMLTGRTPFVGDGFVQLFEQHLNQPPPRIREFVPGTPAALDDLVQELLAKDPESRPFNARSVQGRLGDILEPLIARESAAAKKIATEATSESGQESATTDTGAGQISWGQHAIRQRLQPAQPDREVSWFAIGITTSLLAVILVVVRLFAGGR